MHAWFCHFSLMLIHRVLSHQWVGGPCAAINVFCNQAGLLSVTIVMVVSNADIFKEVFLLQSCRQHQCTAASPCRFSTFKLCMGWDLIALPDWYRDACSLLPPLIPKGPIGILGLVSRAELE